MPGGTAHKRVLVVDPDPTAWRDIQRSAGTVAHVAVSGDFHLARTQLLHGAPDLLVTNLRLGAHNGLHLIYLAKMLSCETRCVVYTSRVDLALIREAQDLGAFFETRERVAFALPGYLDAPLPPADRRAPSAYDRRRFFRGGRRAADVADAAAV
jgi:hypothetical protein